MGTPEVKKVNKTTVTAKITSNKKPKQTPKKTALFNSSASKSKKASAPSTGWSKDFYSIIDKWNVRKYSWTPIENNIDAINKSQKHLIDLIRYYEGDASNNYKAKMKYGDRNNVRTFGYGVVNLPKSIQNKHNISLPPKSEYEAYKAMLIYLDEIAKDDVIRALSIGEKDKKAGQKLFDSVPESVKEALLDLAFNKGYKALQDAKGLKNALKNKDWPTVLKLLVYTTPNSTKAKNKSELAGLHRRSLSRAILAAKDLPKSDSINKAIKNIYDIAMKAAKNENLDSETLEEFENIYNAYKKGSISATTNQDSKTNSDGTKSYRINQEKMGIFSIAKSMRPSTNGTVDSTKLLKAIMYEIIKLNKLKNDGDDENGYPKTGLQTNGTVLKLPTKIKFENKIINLNPPADMEDITTVVTKKPSSDKIKAEKTEKTEQTKQKTKSQKTTKAKKSVPKKVSAKKTVSAKKIVVKTNPDFENELKRDGTPFSRLIKGILHPKKAAQKSGNVQKSDDIEQFGRDNDPASSPFNLLMNDPNKKLRRDRVVVNFNNGKSKTYTTYTISLDYNVKKYSEASNETVWGISHRYGMNMSNFCENNNITDSSYIQAGQIVKIQKLGYKVENGETVNSIAKKFGLTPDILMQLNGIDDDDGINTSLTPGKMIELPGFIYKVKKDKSGKKNESFESIAKRVGIDPRILKHINGNKLSDEIKVLYNNPDYDKQLQSIQTTTINGKKVKKVDMSGVDKDLKTREYLRYKTFVDGLVVANRAEFTPTGSGKLNGRTIIVNAGHGFGQAGRDPGAVVEKNGLKHEWILNYDNSFKLIAKLQAQGARVIYLQGNVNLIQKAMKQPENKGDLFISVHANIGKGDDTTRDRTQFYYRENVQKGEAKENSIMFATIAERLFNVKYKSKNYAEVRTHDERTGVLKTPVNNQKIGGIIWEVAFMDSPVGRKRLQDNRTMNDYTYLLTQAVVKYFDAIDTKKRTVANNTIRRELH